jgi:hypothetical protein
LPLPKLKLRHVCAMTVACVAEACAPTSTIAFSKWVGGVCFQWPLCGVCAKGGRKNATVSAGLCKKVSQRLVSRKGSNTAIMMVHWTLSKKLTAGYTELTRPPVPCRMRSGYNRICPARAGGDYTNACTHNSQVRPEGRFGCYHQKTCRNMIGDYRLRHKFGP